MPSADALKRISEEAVQIARVSPVHREYVPTLGPLEYPVARGIRGRHRRRRSCGSCRGAASRARRRAAPRRSTAPDSTPRERSATAAATANGNRRYFQSSQADMSVTARSADGTGSGYYAGDHFDLARLDAKHIAEQAVGKAVRSREPKAIEPGVYPVILEPQAVSDLMGFLNNALDARTADEGRSAFSGKDGKTRIGEQMFHPKINLYSDPMHAEMPAVPSTERRHSGDAAVARQGRRPSRTSPTRGIGRSRRSSSRRRDR